MLAGGDSEPSRVRFRLLGPLRLWDGTAWVPVDAAQQRVVLALLLLNEGGVVATCRLIDEIWGARPPRASDSVLRGYVMRLRRQLGGGRHGPLRTRTGGYELAVAAGDVDARVFERLVADGRRAFAAGERPTAAARLAEALALWHGAPLADVPATLTVATHARRLVELRLAVTEEWSELYLGLGRSAEVVDALRQLVEEHPLREQLWTVLIRALHRGGRRGEALTAFERARRVLLGELGLEPSAQLQAVHEAILADTHSAEPATGWRAPRQLPADVPGFVGRAWHLNQLARLLPADAERPVPEPVVVCLTGTAGVGKTSLAVHWGHRVAERFPDGQLFVNLHGYDPEGPGLNPAAALRSVLESLQVPADRIPAGVDAAAALYRSLFAGRRILVVLDNARDAGQVRPLLPGTPGGVVVVTTRTDLPGLAIADGARSLPVGLMSAGEARQALAWRLGSRRVAAQTRAVDDLVARCAGLPLALAIVATRAAARPGRALSTVAGELAAALTPAPDGAAPATALDPFASGDPATDVRTVFSSSYGALTEPAARLFRLLAVHPGRDVTEPAAAALTGVGADRVRALLGELTRMNLLAEPVAGRYAPHDLLRAYAGELTNRTDPVEWRRSALERVLDYYVRTADAACRLTDPLQEPLDTAPAQVAGCDGFIDGAHARQWLRAELGNLLAALFRAERSGFDRHVQRLAWLVAGFLARDGRWHDQIAVQRTALAAAARLGDRTGEAHAHRTLGNALARLGRYDDAERHYRYALDAYAGLTDHAGPARVHGHLGWLHGRRGDHTEALTHKQRAYELYRAAGHRTGQARTLDQMGRSHVQLGAHETAVSYCRRAIDMLREAGDRHGEGLAWDGLGSAYRERGAASPGQRHRRVGWHHSRAVSQGPVQCRVGDADLLRRRLADRDQQPGQPGHRHVHRDAVNHGDRQRHGRYLGETDRETPADRERHDHGVPHDVRRSQYHRDGGAAQLGAGAVRRAGLLRGL
ncbi:BTAD domain-containing putative transcriptional regulator [Dactylosporangium sp. NPDC000244]|uniref:AfsR/SARP family transcriptional regulator n=1 Tax=Dactylosporangium sp. NPDC000244 TaxID=3154365 RepID=UPI00332CFD90